MEKQDDRVGSPNPYSPPTHRKKKTPHNGIQTKIPLTEEILRPGSNQSIPLYTKNFSVCLNYISAHNILFSIPIQYPTVNFFQSAHYLQDENRQLTGGASNLYAFSISHITRGAMIL